jgi:phosphatidate cytidylyltransferase
MKRLLTGLFLAGALVPAIFILPSRAMLLLATVISLVGVHEFIGMARLAVGRSFFRVLYLAVPGLVALLAFEPTPRTALVVTTLVALLPWAVVLAARVPLEKGPVAAGLMALAMPYFAVPVVSVYLLHQLGPWFVFLLVAIVVINDSMAYYVGRLFGRHKLAPRVSPKKTWEGALGGLNGAFLATMLWSLGRYGSLDVTLILLGGVTALAAQLGDLAESLLKRGVGVKDSGRLLPGHGGVLDRIDALLFAAPVLYLGVDLLDLVC